MRTTFIRDGSGQALVESAISMTMLLILILGIVDFGRAIYDAEVIKNLAGEGSSMASRGTTATITAGTITNFAGAPVKMGTNGCVIVTIVSNQSGTLTITDQAYQCGIGATSKIGCLVGVNGCRSSNATLPSAAQHALSAEPSGSIMGVTEIYYKYSTITAVTALLGTNNLPSTFYTAAYY